MLDLETAVLEFTAHDRCDQCGAQAYSLARKDEAPSDLLFCIHHRKKHYETLIDEGWEVVDDYEALMRLTGHSTTEQELV